MRLILILISISSFISVNAQSIQAGKIYPRFAIGVTGVYSIIEDLEVVVSDLAAGSPADESGLVAGDILTTINGNTLAVEDPRIPLGLAITAAEASDGQLVFGVQGKSDLTITIPVLGTYDVAWPDGACPKSAQIVDDLVTFITSNQQPDGSYNLSGTPISNDIGACLTGLFLLSTGDDTLLPNVALQISGIIDGIETNPTESCWVMGYQGILLSEYYLRTGDNTVLPALQALCDKAVELQVAGGWSHGSNFNPGYVQSGLMSSAGVPVLTTLILASECGITINQDAYREALKLMYRMVGHGCVPYGNHRPELAWSNTNGRNAMLACAFSLLDDPVSGDEPHYKTAAEHLSMLVVDSYHQPEFGHTGGGFNVMWRGMASSHIPVSQDTRRQRQMDKLSWYYDLARQPGGGFIILPTPPENARYSNYGLDWGCGAFGLTYTAPRNALRITGGATTTYSQNNPPPPFTWGNANDREFLRTDNATGFGTEDDPDAVYESLYGVNKGSVTVAYCENYLRHYSPMVRFWAADRLKDINTTEAHTALANAVTHTDPRVRRAVYDALGGYSGWSRPLDTPIATTTVSSTFLTAITNTLTNPNAAIWEIDGALFAMGNAEPADIRSNLSTILPFTTSDEWWLRESAFWATLGLDSTITGTEFGYLSEAYERAATAFEKASLDQGFNKIMGSGHDAFNFGARGKAVRALGNAIHSPVYVYNSWSDSELIALYQHHGAQRAMMLLEHYDPIVFRYIVDDIAEYLKIWEPGDQATDWNMEGSPWHQGILSIVDNQVGAYGKPIVDELDAILAKYDAFPDGTPEQKALIQASVDNWKALYDPYATPIVPGSSASLTAYYDFEGDYDDAPGAGISSDNMTNNGVSMSADVPPTGSFLSASFNGASSLYTDAFSADLGPDENSYTIMFWIKAADLEQLTTDARILSTKIKPSTAGGGSSTEPAWQSGGFGGGDNENLIVGFGGGGEAQYQTLESPSATNALSQAITDKQWHHVAIVVSNAGHPDYSGDAYSRTFVDGLQIGLESKDDPWTDHPLGNTEGVLIIGADSTDGTANGFTGLLDDIALFSGVVSDNDIAAIASGAQAPDDPLQGAPSASALPPLLGTPSVISSDPGGATVSCDLQQSSADLSLVWAYTDQGETDINTWQTAPGGGSIHLGSITTGTSFNQIIAGLDGATSYNFRFYATNDNASDWSAAESFTTLDISTGDKLKIFILIGQSNMEGQAFTYSNSNTDGWNVPTMEFLLSGSPAATTYMANLPFGFKTDFDSTWLDPRDDVWSVGYDSSNGTTKDVLPSSDAADIYNGIGPLSPGFGVSTTFGSTIGAELAFGHRLGDSTGDPVFLFKSSKGGTTLGNDWRPPSAVTARGGTEGINFTNTITVFTSFLDDLDADLADNGRLDNYQNATDYEVCGVFWLQGWNEQYNDGPYTAAQLQDEYDENLVDLIQSIRDADARIPANLPLIIGESSDQNTTLNTARQAAVDTLNAATPGTGFFFHTNNMIGENYGNNDEGVPFSTNWGYHFNARSENFLEIGWLAGAEALGGSMLGATSDFYLGQPGDSNLTFGSVDLNVRIGGDADIVKLVWDNTDHGGASISDWPNSIDLPAWTDGEGNLTYSFTSLTENTTYTVRFYAYDSTTGNEAWSNPLQFSTPFEDLPPVLGAPSFTGYTSNTADVSCQVTRGPADTVHVVWAYEDQGETDISTWENAQLGGSMALGPAITDDIFFPTLTGLNSATVYSCRFVASNYRGTTWSTPFKINTQWNAGEFILRTYYDFEPDGDPYNDPAGIHADNLIDLHNPALSSDVSIKAKGSSQSASFDGDSYLSTNAYTSDLGPDEDAFTIMFWVKAEDILQENTVTQILTTRFKPGLSITNHPSWTVGGFGNDGTSGGKLDLRTRHPFDTDIIFAPDVQIGNARAIANIGDTLAWHHVAFVVSNSGDPADGGAYAETFLDGVSCGTTSEGTAWDGFNIANPEGQLMVGALGNHNRDLTGLVDDVALFGGIVPTEDIASVASGAKSPLDLVTPPQNFSVWISGYDLGELSGFSDDGDGDNLANGLEYIFGTDAGSANGLIMPISNHGGTISFQHPNNALPTDDITVSYEWSVNLMEFHSSGDSSEGMTVTMTPARDNPVTGTTTVSVDVTGPIPDKMMFRVVASE